MSWCVIYISPFTNEHGVIFQKTFQDYSEHIRSDTVFNYFGLQDQVKGLTHDLSDLEHELDAMKPPGRDLKTVRGQLDDTGKLLKKVSLLKLT